MKKGYFFGGLILVVSLVSTLGAPMKVGALGSASDGKITERAVTQVELQQQLSELKTLPNYENYARLVLATRALDCGEVSQKDQVVQLVNQLAGQKLLTGAETLSKVVTVAKELRHYRGYEYLTLSVVKRAEEVIANYAVMSPAATQEIQHAMHDINLAMRLEQGIYRPKVNNVTIAQPTVTQGEVSAETQVKPEVTTNQQVTNDNLDTLAPQTKTISEVVAQQPVDATALGAVVTSSMDWTQHQKVLTPNTSGRTKTRETSAFAASAETLPHLVTILCGVALAGAVIHYKREDGKR